jgi:hypothetical protein
MILFLVGCDYEADPYYVKENSQLKARISDLENELEIALNINTCWVHDGRNDRNHYATKYYRFGMYNKNTDMYANLVVYKLTRSIDINGKEFLTWDADRFLSVKEVKEKGTRIKCPGVNK